MTLLPPTVEQQRRIDEELPPDPEMRKRDIIALREWLAKQPHLPNHMDDKRLEHFLYGCKNSVERCKLRLETYFSARTALPEFFSARDPLARDIQDICDVVEYFILPKMTEEGYRVTILRLKDTSLDRFSTTALIRRILMVLDVRLQEETNRSNIMVIDLKGFSAGHFAKVSPTQTISRKGMLAIQDSMPFRLHCIHFLNIPSFINTVMNVFYPCFKQKLIEKFRLHTGGGEELHADIEKDILPNEWGGKAGTFHELNESWRLKIEKNRDWYLREEKIGRSNEKLRLPTSKCLITNEFDGVQGSFRKLNID